MKKLFLIFLCGGLLFSASALFAEQKMMVNEAGEIWLVNKVHRWRLVSGAEVRAYQQPGIEVPINLQTGKPKKVDFFHYIPVQEYSEVVVWNGKKFQTMKKAGKEYSKPELAWYIIFLPVAIICMAISNIAMRAGRKRLTFFAVVVTFTTTVSAAFAITSTSFILFISVICIFLIFVLMSTIALVCGDKKGYKIFSTIFYILFFIAIIEWLVA